MTGIWKVLIRSINVANVFTPGGLDMMAMTFIEWSFSKISSAGRVIKPLTASDTPTRSDGMRNPLTRVVNHTCEFL